MLPIWALVQGVKVFSSHKDWVTSIAWSQTSSHYLLTTSHDKTAKLWDLRSSIPLQTLEGHGDKVCLRLKGQFFCAAPEFLLYHNMWSTCCTICNTHKVLVIKPVHSSKRSLWLQLVQYKICKLCNNDTYSIFYKAFPVLSRQVCCENACSTMLTCKILISAAALM